MKKSKATRFFIYYYVIDASVTFYKHCPLKAIAVVKARGEAVQSTMALLNLVVQSKHEKD